MPARSDSTLAGIVLAAAGLVLAAPILGSTGHPVAADLAMLAAAAGGLASFALAACATLRAARRRAGREQPEESRS
jgi:hypothetical protein